MKHNPVFYIVVGPNGAGKSTFGELYLKGIKLYDPDVRRSDIENYLRNLSIEDQKLQFPSYSRDMFEDQFLELVDKLKDEDYRICRSLCIDQKADFALETPFSPCAGKEPIPFAYYSNKEYILLKDIYCLPEWYFQFGTR